MAFFITRCLGRGGDASSSLISLTTVPSQAAESRTGDDGTTVYLLWPPLSSSIPPLSPMDPPHHHWFLRVWTRLPSFHTRRYISTIRPRRNSPKSNSGYGTFPPTANTSFHRERPTHTIAEYGMT